MPTNSDRDPAVTAVIEDIETFTQCLIDKDFDRWLGYWAEDGVLMPPDQPNVVGRENIGTFVRSNFGDVQSMTLSNWAVEVAGDLAAAASDVVWHNGSGGGGASKQVIILRRGVDGRWVRKRVIYARSGP